MIYKCEALTIQKSLMYILLEFCDESRIVRMIRCRMIFAARHVIHSVRTGIDLEQQGINAFIEVILKLIFIIAKPNFTFWLAK